MPAPGKRGSGTQKPRARGREGAPGRPIPLRPDVEGNQECAPQRQRREPKGARKLRSFSGHLPVELSLELSSLHEPVRRSHLQPRTRERYRALSEKRGSRSSYTGGQKRSGLQRSRRGDRKRLRVERPTESGFAPTRVRERECMRRLRVHYSLRTL